MKVWQNEYAAFPKEYFTSDLFKKKTIFSRVRTVEF